MRDRIIAKINTSPFGGRGSNFSGSWERREITTVKQLDTALKSAQDRDCDIEFGFVDAKSWGWFKPLHISEKQVRYWLKTGQLSYTIR